MKTLPKVKTFIVVASILMLLIVTMLFGCNSNTPTMEYSHHGRKGDHSSIEKSVIITVDRESTNLVWMGLRIKNLVEKCKDDEGLDFDLFISRLKELYGDDIEIIEGFNEPDESSQLKITVECCACYRDQPCRCTGQECFRISIWEKELK